jgi:hypothetical protein
LSDKYGITHGVCPEFFVFLHLFRRLLHLTARLDGLFLYLSVNLCPKLRETHGVIPKATAPECPDHFFGLLNLFHVGTSLRHFVFSLYRPRFVVNTGKLIGSVQYFLSVFTFLALSFIVVSP